MRITSVHLKNFRRFTDLEIREIPPAVKLVLLIGSNGSGKSSVFDGFEMLNSWSRREQLYTPFYTKVQGLPPEVSITDENGQEFNNHPAGAFPNFPKENSYYGRTSFRQVARLLATSPRQTPAQRGEFIEKDTDRPRAYIDKDDRFILDIEKVTRDILKQVFQEGATGEEVSRRYVDPLNAGFDRVFRKENGTTLKLVEIIPPLDGQAVQLTFEKGAHRFGYDSLSAGEKEVVNILFNLMARREAFTDTVYFIDELDLHLNTKLQFNLIQEITEQWIPEKCQLWTASHSLGFIDYANQAEHACIVDFDDLDFDQPQVLIPESKSTEVFNVALPKEFVAEYVKRGRFIFCENQDTTLYTGLKLSNTVFTGVVDKHSVFHRSATLGVGLVDRDYLADQEIADIKAAYPHIRILPYYSIENLLYHPDNIEEQQRSAGKPFDKAAYIGGLTSLKNDQKDYLIAGIAKARDGYPYFKENQYSERRKAFVGNVNAVIDLLRSDSIEDFFKVFPAKDLGGALPARQNLNKSHLARTGWFKQQVEIALK